MVLTKLVLSLLLYYVSEFDLIQERLYNIVLHMKQEAFSPQTEDKEYERLKDLIIILSKEVEKLRKNTMTIGEVANSITDSKLLQEKYGN